MYILIISEEESTKFVSLVLFNIARINCPKLEIPKSSDAYLSDVNLILLHTLWICVSLKWHTCCDPGPKKSSSWIIWRGNRLAQHELRCISVVDSGWKTYAESTSYQPWSPRCDSVSTIESRPVHQSLFFHIWRNGSDIVASSICLFHIGDMQWFRRMRGEIINGTLSANWLCYTAHWMSLWISTTY